MQRTINNIKLIIKTLSIIIITYFFINELLNLKDQLSDGRYTIPVETSCKTEKNNHDKIEIFRIKPKNGIEKLGDFINISDFYYFKTDKVNIKNLIIKSNNELNEIKIKIGEKTVIYDKDSIKSDWVKNEKNEYTLKDTKKIKYSDSFLEVFSKNILIINWSGNKYFFQQFIKNDLYNLIFYIVVFISFICFICFSDLLLSKINLIKNDLTEYKLNITKSKSVILIYLIILILISIFLRFPSFNHYIHVDEQTYITIADRMLKGDTLYKEVWDTKSPGLFIYYAAVMFFFNNLPVIRLIGSLIIALSGFFIFLIFRNILGKSNIRNNLIPYISGLSYILISSFNDWNLWINPEELVVLYSLIGLYFVLSDIKFNILLTGLFLGLSFITKYPAILDLFAVGSIWLTLSILNNKKSSYFIKNSLIALLGFIIPSLCIIFFYLLHGNFYYLSDSVYYVLFKYPSQKSMSIFLNIITLFPVKFPVLFIIFLISFLYLIIKTNLKQLKIVLLILSFFSILTIISTGKPFQYYWYQYWQIVAFISPFIILFIIDLVKYIIKIKLNMTFTAIILILLLVSLIEVKNITSFNNEEPIFKIVNYLKPKLQNNELIYANGGGSQILYYSLSIKPLSRYIHQNLNLNTDKEMIEIFNKKPKYIVIFPINDKNWKWFYIVEKNYTFDKEIDRYGIYKIKEIK